MPLPSGIEHARTAEDFWQHESSPFRGDVVVRRPNAQILTLHSQLSQDAHQIRKILSPSEKLICDDRWRGLHRIDELPWLALSPMRAFGLLAINRNVALKMPDSMNRSD